jgi:hypothetical protein
VGDDRRSGAGNVVGNANGNDGPTVPPALVPTLEVESEGAVCVLYPIRRSSKPIDAETKAPFLDCRGTLYPALSLLL